MTTFADAMAQMYLAFLADFTLIGVVFLLVGAPIAFWAGSLWQQHRMYRWTTTAAADGKPDVWLEQVLDEPVFATGTAKVGER